MWVFEQTQALEFFNVYTPVRMTVIRLASGGLWVHAPVAPTEECIRMVKELGEVEYIVLPTFAYEHKAFVGPFSRRFPKAKVGGWGEGWVGGWVWRGVRQLHITRQVRLVRLTAGWRLTTAPYGHTNEAQTCTETLPHTYAPPPHPRCT